MSVGSSLARDGVPDGLAVVYVHRRVTSCHGIVIEPRGGSTDALIFNDDDAIIAEGRATCHPRDNYCKRLGRTIALGRALKALRDG